MGFSIFSKYFKGLNYPRPAGRCVAVVASSRSLRPPIPRSCPYTDVAPLSTPRAIARGSGWGCFVGRVSSPLLLPLISSCLVSPSSPPRRHSTHPPPHKQLLVRLGVGGVSSRSPLPAPTCEPPCEQVLAAVCSPSPVISPPSHLPSPSLFHHQPPHEQLLVRLEARGASSVVGVVVVRHLSAVVSGSKGVRGASVTWHVLRGWEVPTVWVSHSLGLPASLIALLYLNGTPHIPF